MPASDLINALTSTANRYCIDKQFLAAIARSPNATWEQQFLEYILVTGANWSGPIRNFRLVIDKGSAENLTSFCAKGVRKITPTQFELRISNFIPTSNLSVLILKPGSDPLTDFLDPSTNLTTLNCEQLWQQRNSIFKKAKYCFRTARAISTFGNEGCRYNSQSDVPLSDRDRNLMNGIQRIERVKRCPQ
jgi:hypothetical protein